MSKEVPLYRKDQKNLVGRIDNYALHKGTNGKRNILLFEVKSNDKWRSKAHRQLDKEEKYLDKELKGTGVDYKIYKFHVYGYRRGYKVEWYRKEKK